MADDAPLATEAPGRVIRERKRALIERDPLGTDLTEMLRILYRVCEKERARHPNLTTARRRVRHLWENKRSKLRRLWQRATALRANLQNKYSVHVAFPTPDGWLARLAGRPESCRAQLDKPWRLTEGALGLEDEAPMRARTNWTLPDGSNLIFDLPPRPRPRPPIAGPRDGHPPTLTVEVDMSRITLHDLDRLADEFKAAVRYAWEGRPDELLRPPSLRPPAQLAFLRTTDDATFDRFLRRYDLHMRGLSFRQIADLERAERRGQPPREQPSPRRVGSPVQGEDAVARSAQRIYEAIHGRPYSSRRPRTEAAEPFSCPEHPARDCDGDCKHLRAWLAHVTPTLPFPSAGRLRGEFMPAEFEPRPEDADGRRRPRRHR